MFVPAPDRRTADIQRRRRFCRSQQAIDHHAASAGRTGILNLENAVTCPIYFVEPIVNLFDDPEKTGVFNMRYTAVNLSDKDQVYELDVYGLYDYVTQGYNTLTSDYLFDGNGITVEGATTITVPANGTYEGKLKITLDDDAKEYFDATFANGNFIEGYVYFVNQDPGAANDSPGCGRSARRCKS